MDNNDTNGPLPARETRGFATLEARMAMSARKLKKPCGCPVSAFQKMISGKYKIRILWDLREGPRRYGEIRRGLLTGAAGTAEVTPRVLSRELKALAQSGLIARKDHGVVPPKVEYRLTRVGRSFLPVIAAMRQWGIRHLGRPPAASASSGGPLTAARDQRPSARFRAS